MRSLLLLLLATVFFTSCSDDPVLVDAGVIFRLKYDGEPLVMLDDYQYPDGRTLNFTRVSFYLEDLVLSDDDNTYTLVERDYLNLTNAHSDATSAQRGVKYSIPDVEEGNYRISFKIGVNPTDNQKDPSEFTSDNVLSYVSEYWAPWQSYIFTRIEGNIDLDDDGQKETGFALHMGGDDAYRNLSTDFTLPIDEGTKDMIIEIDLVNLFGSGNDIYDIDADPQIHRLDQNDLVIELANNFITGFTVGQ